MLADLLDIALDLGLESTELRSYAILLCFKRCNLSSIVIDLLSERCDILAQLHYLKVILTHLLLVCVYLDLVE